MSLLDRLVIAAGQEKAEAADRTPKPLTIRVPINDFGDAKITIEVGDVDGSGEAPGVNLVFEHDFIGNGIASVALSAREAEAVGQKLLTAASKISPSERLRPMRKRLKEGRRKS